MKDLFRAVEVADKVYWVGAVDWGVRNFHGYLTSRGTTYNAYLVLADKITLIDTVKAQFYDEMMSRIASVVDPSRIELVVSNHSEMDHSGGLPRFVHSHKPKKVFASRKGVEALAGHFHWSREVEAVKTGDRLDLGNASLTFVETPMLHWPDSMFSLLEPQGVLFSNDAFGMHLASSERFADELDQDLLRYEAAKYYANILMPLSPLVKSLLEKQAGLLAGVRIIAPDHGPIWREKPERIASLYSSWSAGEVGSKAVVVYDTMWSSTSKMARAIGEGISRGGAEVKLMPLESCHRSEVATELLGAGALVVGSPTMNNQLYPTVADLITYIKGLKPKGLIGASFGSYGWSGEAIKQLDALLAEMKVELIRPGLGVVYAPGEQDLAACISLGDALASKLKG